MKIVRALTVSLIIVASLHGADYHDAPSFSSQTSSKSSDQSATVSSQPTSSPEAATSPEQNLTLPKWSQEDIRYQVLREDIDKVSSTVKQSHAIIYSHVDKVGQTGEWNAKIVEVLVKQNEILKNNIENLEKMMKEWMQMQNTRLGVSIVPGASTYFWNYAKPTAALAIGTFLIYKLYQKYSAKEDDFQA